MPESYREDGRPSQQWYWGDWFSAFDVRLCSLEARGLWIDMLGIMFQSEVRGTLTINGKKVNSKTLAKVVGYPEDKIAKLLQKLESKNVFSRLNDGTIICRRMYRESGKKDELKIIRSKAGKKGAKTRWQKDKQNKANIASSTSSSSSSSSSSPTSKPNKEESIKKKEKIDFNFKERKFINITIEDKAGWLEAYPACDIDQELSKMREWLLGNPAKRKKNYRRFISNWLSRAQEKGGTRIDYKTSQVGRDSGKHKTKYPSNFLHKVYGILNKQNKDQNKYADIIFSLSDEEAKTAVEKYNKSPGDFIKFLEEHFQIKLKGNQDG